MSERFPAYLIEKSEQGQSLSRTELSEADLMPGNVTVRVEWSTLNYKDGLALTGASPVVRRFPMIPGIDFAGVVESSEDPRFSPGESVILNGWGVGEVHYGGYAGMARVPGDWLVHLPEGLGTRQAMAVGTAGYTAMLCVMALQDHGIGSDEGDILVTGAAGGVGSVATALLADLGFRVVAVTGRPEQAEFLQSLGASEIVSRSEFAGKAKPIAKERWAGAVDVAGGNMLANVLSQTKRSGAVAACGLAESMDLPTSVAPFILRGVTLYGIDSVMAPLERRQRAWEGIVAHLDPDLLENLTEEVAFEDLPSLGADILKGQVRGRVVVRIPH
jgi:acrylyl-CoA reductase (NADPH)